MLLDRLCGNSNDCKRLIQFNHHLCALAKAFPASAETLIIMMAEEHNRFRCLASNRHALYKIREVFPKHQEIFSNQLSINAIFEAVQLFSSKKRSERAIVKNVRILFLLSLNKSSIFKKLPFVLLAKIAGLTSGLYRHTEKEISQIASDQLRHVFQYKKINDQRLCAAAVF